MTDSSTRSSGNRKSGEIVATLLSVWLGLASLVCSHIWSMAKPDRANLFLLKMGVWIPGWEKIGSYAGKETIGLIVWIVSWLLLFFLLKNREFSLKHWLYAFVAGMIIIVVFIWPPVIHALFGWNPTTVY